MCEDTLTTTGDIEMDVGIPNVRAIDILPRER